MCLLFLKMKLNLSRNMVKKNLKTFQKILIGEVDVIDLKAKISLIKIETLINTVAFEYVLNFVDNNRKIHLAITAQIIREYFRHDETVKVYNFKVE